MGKVDYVDPRDVIMSLRVEGDEYLKFKMLAKYNDLAGAEADLNRLHRKASRMKDFLTATFAVAAALMAISAAMPLPNLAFGSLTVEPKHITALFGLVMSALFFFDRAMGYGELMLAYADLSRKTNALCERLAFAVRSESEFLEVLEDDSLLREYGAAQLLGWR